MERLHRVRTSPFATRHTGMTLIELLVVIVIIAVLASAVLVASTSLIGKSKTRNTQAVLQVVADAVEQFKRSETEKPTLTRNPLYKKRYGAYPPDELEVFSGTPPTTTSVPYKLAVPTGSLIKPAPPFESMKFYLNDDCSGPDCQAKEHRDLAAMIVAIESQGGEAQALLDRIPDRNRTVGVLDNTKAPAQYLDRPAGINGTPSGKFDSDDLQIRYITDDWGNPLTYFTQRDNNPLQDDATKSSNQPDWNHVSTELVHLNDGKPLIMSYGANGKEQLTRDAMKDNAEATIPYDFEHNADPGVTADIIDNPLNADNIYSKQGLGDLLLKGLP